MEKIRIEGQEFEIEIKKKRIRSLRLRIQKRNLIEISVPWLMPKMMVENFIKSNKVWIKKQNEKIKEKKNFEELRDIYILGERFKIEQKKSNRDSLVIMDKIIYLNYLDKNKAEKVFDKKMRNLALKIIKERVEKLARGKELNYGRVGVKNQSSRFGSCSSRGNLNFNWQIILFPEDKFEHVIWHELAHLTVKNHSKDFWELLANYDSNWRENNKWLKKEGTKIFIV